MIAKKRWLYTTEVGHSWTGMTFAEKMCFCFTKVRLFEQSWLLHFLVSKFINSMENIICIHCLHFYSRINTKPWNMFVITQIFEKNIKLVKYLISNCAYVLLFFNNFHREEWFLTYQREYLLKLHFSRLLQNIFFITLS